MLQTIQFVLAQAENLSPDEAFLRFTFWQGSCQWAAAAVIVRS